MNSVGSWSKLVVVYLKIQLKGLPSLKEEAGELNYYVKVSGS